VFGVGIWEVLILLIIFGWGVLGSIFWLWMLVECATREAQQGNNKIVWVLIIALTHVIGALIYFVVRRPQRMAMLGR
jgi:hypothetical protein